MLKENVQKIYRDIKKYYDLTIQVSQTLTDEDFDLLFRQLQAREHHLEVLKQRYISETFVAQNCKKDLNFKKIKSLIKEVNELDQQSKGVIAAKLQSISASLLKLNKERTAVKKQRHFTKGQQKKIVDVLH